jgi:hypothetical protein
MRKTGAKIGLVAALVYVVGGSATGFFGIMSVPSRWIVGVSVVSFMGWALHEVRKQKLKERAKVDDETGGRDAG